MLLGTGPKGDVELVPEMAEFKSGDEFVLRRPKGPAAYTVVAIRYEG